MTTTQRNALNLKENLTDKFVAFIDVMGFSNLVNRDSVADLESYFLKVTEVLNKIRADKGEIQSLLISDAIILIAPPGLKGLRDIIVATRRIQSELLWRKILLRGAISYGQIFYDKKENIIVGKGFIKAYLLEQEAICPRVIIDPSIIKIVAEDKEGFFKSLHKNTDDDYDDRLVYRKSSFSLINDDCIFVDYANKTIFKYSMNGNIKRIYETINKNLYGDQKLYSKYVWLRDYFLERLKLNYSFLESEWIDNVNQTNSIKKQGKDLAQWIEKFERL